MKKLLVYQRQPIDNVYYDPRLAFSAHLALYDGSRFVPLNHNSGVLFAKADENEDGSLEPKCLDKPFLFKDAKGYGIAAIRTDGEGQDDPAGAGRWFVYYTKDFLDYEDGVYVENAPKASELKAVSKEYTDIEGCIPGNVIEITDEVADRLVKKLNPAVNTAVEVPGSVEAPAGKAREILFGTKAVISYSDGTSREGRVDWDYSTDYEKPGEYLVKGRLHQDHYDFPIAYDRADPCMGKWNGKYYFIATNDADNNHTLYIREADTIPELVTAEEHLILDSTTYPEIGGLLWAPEFHIINGRMYIFHACTPEPFFHEESHVLALKEGGNPCNKDDWEKPRRVCMKDGSDICVAGNEITLDMTEFEWEGAHYVIWSQRQFLPKDLGAWLYIARLNPDEPWKLDSDIVVLSKPDYGWGNNHTFVEEGPFALIRDDVLYITFSAAAVDTSYVVGLLSLKKGLDPLNPKNWYKKGYPILTSRSVEGEFGTGHNAYVIDDDGLVWNTYHARPGTKAPRSSGVRRVHFDIDGEPALDMTEELDIKPELKDVSLKLTVK